MSSMYTKWLMLGLLLSRADIQGRGIELWNQTLFSLCSSASLRTVTIDDDATKPTVRSKTLFDICVRLPPALRYGCTASVRAVGLSSVASQGSGADIQEGGVVIVC